MRRMLFSTRNGFALAVTAFAGVAFVRIAVRVRLRCVLRFVSEALFRLLVPLIYGQIASTFFLTTACGRALMLG